MRVKALVVVVAASLAGVAGCSSPDGGAVTSPPAAPVVVAPGQDVLAAYEGMWRAFGDASRSADWQSPELARYATGYALDQLVQGLQADEVLGVVTTGVHHQPGRCVGNP